MLLNYDASVNYNAMIRGLSEKREGLPCCVNLMGSVVDYLKAAQHPARGNIYQMTALGKVIVELIILCESTGVPFDALTPAKTTTLSAGNTHGLSKEEEFKHAIGLMHWVDRIALTLKGKGDEEQWYQNEMSVVVPLIAMHIALTAWHLGGTFHQCTYYGHKRLKMTKGFSEGYSRPEISVLPIDMTSARYVVDNSATDDLIAFDLVTESVVPLPGDE